MTTPKLLTTLGLCMSAVLCFGVWYVSNHIARDTFSYSIHDVPQNAFNFVNQTTQNIPLLSAQKQRRLASHYLTHYFAPWHLPITDHFIKLKHVNRDMILQYVHHPGYGINHLPNSVHWIHRIARNMDMTHFPNTKLKVITVQNTNLRNLPTHQPSFGNFQSAGQGYPFDNLQTTSVVANTPAFVIQKTQDGAWSFMITQNSYGWVPTPDLAAVDDDFVRHWETGHYVAVIRNHVSMVDRHGLMRFKTGVGAIFPIKGYSLFMAIANTRQKAVITKGRWDHAVETQWPLLLTKHNIAIIMNAMLGVKYGWGGINGDSDCSLTTMNLFATFGIWLPRNSYSQASVWHVFHFYHQNAVQKEKTLRKYGIAFVTLLHIPYPGHIAVYLGEKQGRVYIFQTVWGVDTDLFGKLGRAIIGATVITPADLGRHALNVPKTWLEKMNQMTVL